MTRPTTIPATVAEPADAAATRIETHGWHVGAMYDKTHQDPWTAPACASGALWLSAGIDPARATVALWKGPKAELVRQVEARLEALPQIRPYWVPVWNDAPGRTAEQVVAAFRAVARIACAEVKTAGR